MSSGTGGGELNGRKTEWICVRSTVAGVGLVDRQLDIGESLIEQVTEFRYLGSGSIVGCGADLGQSSDVQARVRAASSAFGRLRGLWGDPRVAMSSKRSVFLACVRTTLLWGVESWTQRAAAIRSLRRAWYGWIRHILGLSWRQCAEEHISWADLRDRFGVLDIADYAAQATARWMGHVARLPATRLPVVLLSGVLAHRGSSLVQSERATLHRTLVEHMRHTVRRMSGVDELVWTQLAQDRREWRQHVARLRRVKHAGPPQRGESTSTCSLCGKFCRSAAGLRLHISARHPVGAAAPAFPCDACLRSFGSQVVLTRHVRAEHAAAPLPQPAPSVLPVPPAPRLQCPRCQHVCAAVGHYNLHLRTQCPLRDVPIEAGPCRDGDLWRCPGICVNVQVAG